MGGFSRSVPISVHFRPCFCPAGLGLSPCLRVSVSVSIFAACLRPSVSLWGWSPCGRFWRGFLTAIFRRLQDFGPASCGLGSLGLGLLFYLVIYYCLRGLSTCKGQKTKIPVFLWGCFRPCFPSSEHKKKKGRFLFSVLSFCLLVVVVFCFSFVNSSGTLQAVAGCVQRFVFPLFRHRFQSCKRLGWLCNTNYFYLWPLSVSYNNTQLLFFSWCFPPLFSY